MIEEALRKIGADRIIEKYAKGIHERVAEMGANYSVGERQLISFARALVYDPAVLDVYKRQISASTTRR